MPRTISERIITRETACTYRGIPIVVEIHPLFVELRLKRHKESFVLRYDAALETAMKIEARERRELAGAK
jgi:hypothetical protein